MRTGLWAARSDLIEDGRRTASARIANRFAGDPLQGASAFSDGLLPGGIDLWGMETERDRTGDT